MDAYWQPPLLPGFAGRPPRSIRSRLRSWSLWPTTAMIPEAVETDVNGPVSGGDGEW
jgi:hypothetical protein